MVENKKYIVSKNFNPIGKGKVARGTKIVDSRMKKDVKIARQRAKKGKGGKGGKRKGGRK